MAEVTFTIPSILNGGGGERKATVSAARLDEAFGKVSGLMGDDFARRVLNADGTPRALINIYVNGKNSKFADGMNTELKDNDEVYLLPAVAGGSDLSGRELDRYSRQVMLEEIGYGGQLKLRAARVCIVGAGGLGNPIAARLVAMGVGRVRLVDRDVIELSNLHRQTLFGEDDVGRVKVEAAADHLRKMNSDVRIEPLAVSVNRYNAPEVVDGCDVVIDALDSVDARYALNQACVAKNIPFVTGAAVGVSGQAFTILPGETACYYCMFPELDEDSMPTCSIEGVHPPILSIIGAIEVAEAVSVILGRKPALSDRIMHVDLGTLDFS
jgi:adenylyltransferase/sulfurtransferase